MGKSKGKKEKGKKTEKKVKKIVEDRTFGLKNKNKSKKVQKYIEQVNNSARHAGGKNSRAQQEQRAAAKRAEKEARKNAELEMFKLLGDAYKPKAKLRSKKSKKKEEEEKQKQAEQEAKAKQEQHEKDFAIPIITLNQVFQLDSKAEVSRLCVVLEHKDNLVSKSPSGSGEPCLLLKISDGSTLNPFTLVVNGETPTSFQRKVGDVLDIRHVIAMVRGEKVLLETDKSKSTLELTSEALKEHVISLKEENEEIRAQGGIPVEQLIEEQRAKLLSDDLTPVTKERFFAWKEKKKAAREEEAQEKRKKEEKKSGKSVKNMNVLTGRQLFVVDKSLFKDDDNAWDEKEQEAKVSEEKEQEPEVSNEDLFLDEDIDNDEGFSDDE